MSDRGLDVNSELTMWQNSRFAFQHMSNLWDSSSGNNETRADTNHNNMYIYNILYYLPPLTHRACVTHILIKKHISTSLQQHGVQHSHQKTHQHTHLFNNYNRLYNMAFNSRGMSTLATTSPLWASSWDPQLPTWALFYSTLCSLFYYFLLQLTLMSSLFYYVLLYRALLWSLFYCVILYFLRLTLSVSSCTVCLLCLSL